MVANANCPIPNNINPLSPTGFRFSITKLPEVSFFCQEIALPDINLPNIQVGTPLSMLNQPGEIITYGDLTLNFLVDEDMKNYKAVYNWLIGLGFPESHDQYATFNADQQGSMGYQVRGAALDFSDGTLDILGSNNISVKTINFIDLIPVSLSSLQFTSMSTDVTYLTGSATFKYTYYNFAT